MKPNVRLLLYLSLTFFSLTFVLLLFQHTAFAEIGAITSLILLALGLQGHPTLKGFAFTVWIFAAVTAAMLYPQYFLSIGDFDLKKLIVPLLMIIMFGMGTEMSVSDFVGVIKMPKGVLIGLLCQFTIMPFVGFGIASVFNFPPEIAAGIILVGCSPSGLASNVMAYLAKANLALSLTLTAVATLLAPLVTPTLMTLLANQLVPIDFWAMMKSILQIVIIPIAAGLLFNHFLKKKFAWLGKVMPVVSMVGIGVIITIITASGRDNLLAVGLLLIVAAILHNLLGYFFGYWAGKLFKMDEKSCRTIAFEVGMQNSGLASGIALTMNKLATMGLAPAIFGPWMNISGSSLASWWRDR